LNWAGSILKPGIFIMLDKYLKSFTRLWTDKTEHTTLPALPLSARKMMISRAKAAFIWLHKIFSQGNPAHSVPPSRIESRTGFAGMTF
jgi:hypothetical protein